jgi:alanine racemase
MVKATGYGAGSSEIAFTLQHHNVNYLAVAYTDEGVDLRKAGIHLPIMVMSPEESSYDDLIDYKLEPEIYSFKVAHEFINALQNKAIAEPYPIHIKLDTGMHRLGFEETELDALIDILVVTIGAIHSMGADAEGAWKEVMSTNFAKIDKETGKVRKREDGKVLKPTGWVPPNLEPFLTFKRNKNE